MEGVSTSKIHKGGFMYSFTRHLEQHGLTPAKPLNPVLDGKVHRFDIEGRPHGKKHGWYVGHDAGD